MKTLILIRHAKSSWTDLSITDFERTLNDRGKHDAPIMAERIKKNIPLIDAFVASTAKRARKTAKLFMKVYGEKENKLIEEASLYEAPMQQYYRVIEKLDNSFNTVAIFAHNPGITDFVNSLDCTPVYNMPTCGVYAIEIDIDDWSDFEAGAKRLLFFDYPKNED
ncbi:MAG: histidine phosphatase family protein [Ginsengibacter sp.]|jgi:phosphohistidine phosphatase